MEKLYCAYPKSKAEQEKIAEILQEQDRLIELKERILGEDGCSSRGGVIWHTQGSGKSLTMVMLVKRILAEKRIHSPRFVLVCDRINLIMTIYMPDWKERKKQLDYEFVLGV